MWANFDDRDGHLDVLLVVANVLLARAGAALLIAP